MKHLKTLIIALLLCISQVTAATVSGGKEPACFQTFDSGIAMDLSKLKPYTTDDPVYYTGVYSFGKADFASCLMILFLDGQPVVQYRKKNQDKSTGKILEECRTLTPVSIEGNRFTAQGWAGEFKVFTVFSEPEIINTNLVVTPYPIARVQGLVIDVSPVDIRNEFGVKLENGFKRFPRASTSLLDESDLRGKSKKDLKIMRNEIFARYGRQFKPGGAMDLYFRSTDWYTPRYPDVYHLLTDIEKANIAFIRSHE